MKRPNPDIKTCPICGGVAKFNYVQSAWTGKSIWECKKCGLLKEAKKNDN